MTKIKATCPDCGDVSISSDKVTVRILEGSDGNIGQYRFKCPSCRMIVLKSAESRILALLTAADDINIEMYSLPIELLERPLASEAEPITADEIIDLHFQLENEEEWMRKMIQGGPD